MTDAVNEDIYHDNSDSGKDVAAKLAQLDEKLHVEEKIKDGAENLLQVRETSAFRLYAHTV